MSDGLSVIFYIILFLLSAAVLHIGLERKNKVFIAISLAIPIIISSFRYGVGTDYYNYITFFEKFSGLGLREFIEDSSAESPEAGFYLLIKLSEILTGDYILMFAISSFLTVFFFYLGLRRLPIKHKPLVYLLFLLMLFPFTFNAVRQGISISICFYALTFVMDKKFIKYSFWILIASLFHISVLLMYPVYLLNKVVKKYKRNTDLQIILRISLLAAIIVIVIPYIFNFVISLGIFERYDTYQDITGTESSYDFLVRLTIIATVLIFLRRLVLEENSLSIYFILSLAAIDLALSTLGLASTFIARIGLYLTPFSYILLAQLVSVFEGRPGKNIAQFGIILFGMLYFCLTYYYYGQSDAIPYKVIPLGVIS